MLICVNCRAVICPEGLKSPTISATTMRKKKVDLLCVQPRYSCTTQKHTFDPCREGANKIPARGIRSPYLLAAFHLMAPHYPRQLTIGFNNFVRGVHHEHSLINHINYLTAIAAKLSVLCCIALVAVFSQAVYHAPEKSADDMALRHRASAEEEKCNRKCYRKGRLNY